MEISEYRPKSAPTASGSRYKAAARKALRLIRSGQAGLLLSIPLYRLGWRLRGLDFGVVSLEELGLDPNRSNHHKDGGGPLLRDLLNRLTITERDVVLDFGSGKGGAMATLAQYPFRRVDGVEISPRLFEVARKNLTKLKLQQCRLFLADATNFTDLDDYTYIFIYNSFPAVVVRQVLGNIEDSLRRRPRVVQLVYSNPLHAEMILASRIFQTKLIYQPYPEYRVCVYENEANRIVGPDYASTSANFRSS